MAVQGTFYRTETQRLGVTPVSPPQAVDDPVGPVNPPGSTLSHDPVTLGSPANGLSLVGQQLSIGIASSGVTGALSGTDWNTFNGKLNLTSPITGFTVGANTELADTDTILQAFGKVQGQINARVSGTATSGQVAFWNGTNSISSDSGITWNNTTKQFNVTGSTYPVMRLDRTTTSINNTIINSFDIKSTTSLDMVENFGAGATFTLQDSGATLIAGRLQFLRGSTDLLGKFQIVLGNAGTLIPFSISETGQTLIGPLATPTNTLDVNGTARIRTINNLGTAATVLLTKSATGVISERTVAEVRSDLGATTLGANLFTIPNPSAITFPRFNADNTVSALSASDFRTAIGAINTESADTRYLRKDINNSTNENIQITFDGNLTDLIIAGNGTSLINRGLIGNGNTIINLSSDEQSQGRHGRFSVSSSDGINRFLIRTQDLGSPGIGSINATILFRGRGVNDTLHTVVNGSDTVLYSMLGSGRSKFYTFSPEIPRSNTFDRATRQDELYLNYSETVATTGTINDLTINASTKLLILTGADDLTGVVGENTRLLRIEARGASRIIRHESASSTAANRFSIGSDLTINSGEVYQFIYTDSRWRRVL